MEKIIKYTRHARRRMKWRKISEFEIRQTVEYPDKIELDHEGRKNAFKMLSGRYLRTTYREIENEIIIVSVVNKLD